MISVILIVSDLIRIRKLKIFKKKKQLTLRQDALLKSFERCIVLYWRFYLQHTISTVFIFSPGIGVIDPCMISVSVCASGNICLFMNISGSTESNNLKFWTCLEKVLTQVNLQELNVVDCMLTRGGYQIEPKRLFFYFFTNNSGI